MWQRLQQDHNLVIGKETVRHVLRIVDTEGVEQRSRHRLRRRKKGAKNKVAKKRREKQKIKWNCWIVRQIGARIVGFMVKAPNFAQR